MDRTQAGVPGVSGAMHHLRVSQGFALLCGKRLFAYRFLNDAVHSPSPVLVPGIKGKSVEPPVVGPTSSRPLIERDSL